jgi:multimeric flavodoxin WrbA
MSTSGTGGRVLGLGCGQPDGSAEILLKAALRAAEGEGAGVELVRLDELRLPSGAAEAAEPDDAWWLWERLVECDGLIVSTPIISRTVAARLKLLGDRLLGPNADAAIIAGLLALRSQGREPAVPFRVDERVLKPRVAGFLAVGGSLTPQWKTLTLPIMHTTTFSMHIAVVDQVQFAGAGTPRSVVLDTAAIDRAAVLGRNVASQLGVAFDEARYLGPPGLCPMCHLDVVALHGADVECATCGARGRLGPGPEVTWTDLSTSVISMAEKQSHAVEIQETAERHRDLRPEIDQRARAFETYDRTVRPDRTPASGLPVRRHCLSWQVISLMSLAPIFHWMAVPPWLVNAAQLSARSSISTASGKPTPWAASHGPKNPWGSSLLSVPVWLEQMMSSQMAAQSARVSRSRFSRRLVWRARAKARAKQSMLSVAMTTMASARITRSTSNSSALTVIRAQSRSRRRARKSSRNRPWSWMPMSAMT